MLCSIACNNLHLRWPIPNLVLTLHARTISLTFLRSILLISRNNLKGTLINGPKPGEILVGINLINLGEDDLDINIKGINPGQKLLINILQAMLKINQQEHLRQPRTNLHILLNQTKPQMPSLLIHIGIAITRGINEHGVVMVDLVKVKELCGTRVFGVPAD